MARSKKQKIIIPGLWFFEKNRTQQEEYKKNNRPKGCENCTDHPIHSNDGLKTWMCGYCQFNEFRSEKKPHICSSEQKSEAPLPTTPPKIIQF